MPEDSEGIIPLHELEASSVLKEADMRRCIEFREIKEEDFHHIVTLAGISKKLLIENFHNYFF